MYAPEKVLDNAYFEKIVDTTDEWITTRTGIKERRILENGATSDLAVKAVEDMFAHHKVNPEEIDAVIIATGADPKKLGCPGEKEYWGKGVTTCAVCDGAFYPDKRVIVVGGGDTAMEDASFMTKFTDKITIVQNQDALTASHVMQKRVLEKPSITILYSSTITKIQGDGSHITHAEVTDLKTKKKQLLEVDGIFLAIGLQPSSEAFKDQVELEKWGYIRVENHTRTSIEGIFVAGDVADWRYRQAITSAATGCKAALDAERYLKNSIDQ